MRQAIKKLRKASSLVFDLLSQIDPILDDRSYKGCNKELAEALDELEDRWWEIEEESIITRQDKINELVEQRLTQLEEA